MAATASEGRAAVLVLEDGFALHGLAHFLEGEVFGEVVFTTAMTGYQEVVTDPSFAGQIVVFTYPLIGNYGVHPEEAESARPQCQAIIVREFTDETWGGRHRFSAYLREHGIPVLEKVDTRALTRHIRTLGAMRGGISTRMNEQELYEAVRQQPGISDVDWVLRVTRREVQWLGDGVLKVAVLDYGVKRSIVRYLLEQGFRVGLYPAKTPVEEILRAGVHGVVLSNGPGDPAILHYAQEQARQLVGKVPVFGICLGHQILALALGGKTYKMKFGHRGANHPVIHLKTQRVRITTQNHGFAVDPDSLKGTGLEVTEIALNDGTVEGMAHRELPVWSVQYHPEGAPGPLDSVSMFQDFLRVVLEHLK